MDKHKIKEETASQRSLTMAAVKSRGNLSTEIKMLRLLRANKLTGWRRHIKIEGTPDFAWPKKKVALFVDGCFWHKCPHCFRGPKSNKPYWEKKIKSNEIRDRRTNRVLRSKGWTVIRIWECQIEQSNTVKRLRKAINQSESPKIQQ